MKKLICLLAVTTLCVGNLAAQNWKDALTKIATNAADKLTDGKLTEAALIGTWTYAQPGVKFEGEDITTDLAGSLVESTVSEKLAKAYSYASIQPGKGSFTFNSDNTFTGTLGKHELSGTYEFNASEHTIVLHFAKGTFNLGTMTGHVYISGSELQLVFPVTKLVNMVTKLGSKVSSLATVSQLLAKYKNVYIGFAFKK